MTFRKLSWLGIVPMAAILFFSCQKNVLNPSLTSEAKGGSPGGGTTGTPAFVYSQPTFDNGCEGSDYCFDASVTKKNGGEMGGSNNSITVTVFNSENVQVDQKVAGGTSGTFCFSELTQGQYSVQVYYRHANNDQAQVNVPFTFTLTIGSSGDCNAGAPVCTADGVSLTRSSSVVEADNSGNVVNVQSTYTVHNCGDEPVALKLQGGLVNKATLNSPQSTSGAADDNIQDNSKTTAGNTVLSWTFTLPAGGTQLFSVDYNVGKFSCGGYLSGAWSLKKDGIPVGVSLEDESAIQNGYLDRLTWNCQ